MLTCVSAWQVLGHLLIVGVRDLAKVLGSQLAQVLMGDASGSGQDHSATLVVGLDVVQQIIPDKKYIALVDFERFFLNVGTPVGCILSLWLIPYLIFPYY